MKSSNSSPKTRLSATFLSQASALFMAFTVAFGGLGKLKAVDVAPVLTAFTPGGNGIVSGEIAHQLSYTGTATSFSVTGLPQGLTLNTKTGWITGRPLIAGDYSITFTAWNGKAKSAPLTIDWTVQPLPVGTAGTFNALIDRHDWYNGGFGGSVQITVTAFGTYSGYITRGVHRTAVKGVLDTNSEVGPRGSFTVARRHPYVPLAVAFTLPVGTGLLTGTLQEPNGDVIQISGYRAAFSTATPATAYVGQWNTAFELPPELTGNAAYPQGAGWAMQTISNAGSVAWVAKLADGTSATFSSSLGSIGQTAVHLMLYGYAGSLQGTQSFNHVSSTTSGSFGWVKKHVHSRSYSTGFALHFLDVNGARYTAPGLGEQIFGIPVSVGNARLIFTQGGLSTPFSQIFTIGSGNVVSMPTGSANPYKIGISANFKTGLISGSGTAMDYSQNQPSNARPGSFNALLIPGREQAVGHFLLPTGHGKYDPILSGKLIGEENTAQDQ